MWPSWVAGTIRRVLAPTSVSDEQQGNLGQPRPDGHSPTRIRSAVVLMLLLVGLKRASPNVGLHQTLSRSVCAEVPEPQAQ